MKFISYLEIKISQEQRNLAMDTILKNHLSYKHSEVLSDSGLILTISPSYEKSFQKVFSENGIKAEFSQSKGLISFVARYKHRYGLILGVIFLILMVNLSSNFIWRIEIAGNESVSSEEIIQELENSGCSLGTYIPSIDYDELHNKFLINSKDISWISVNIKGNVAKVFVRERLKEESKEKNTYTNVISKYDAQIASIRLYNGKKVVSIGDVVKKGDILVSGILNSQSQGVRYVHADGIIMAYVNKPILVKIPFISHDKVYTGVTHKEKSIKIFSKTIFFSSKYSNDSKFCDKIETNKKLGLFEDKKLPIEINTIYFREYEIHEIKRTYDQAVDLAFAALKEEMILATSDAELLSKEVKTYFDEEAFYIECNLYCLENIASLVEFEVKN